MPANLLQLGIIGTLLTLLPFLLRIEAGKGPDGYCCLRLGAADMGKQASRDDRADTALGSDPYSDRASQELVEALGDLLLDVCEAFRHVGAYPQFFFVAEVAQLHVRTFTHLLGLVVVCNQEPKFIG